MSPESNSTTENRIVSGQTVRVPKPDAGAEIAITSSPGGVLDLPFDPGTATTTRVDNSLVFELDGGGKVTVTDFFAVGDESLPNLRLPDGVEVASVDFFEGSGLDMTTAAGPGAGTPPGSGTSYDDDGGNLLNGVDKYGMLGTDYWGRDTEPDIEMRGVYAPGGNFNFGAFTPDTPGAGGGIGIFGGFVYEDARPTQHIHGSDPNAPGTPDVDAGRLVAVFTPNPGSYTDSVNLWDFPEGTQVWLGDPANGGTLLTPDANGVYTFLNPEVFEAGDPTGVYIIPPENSDDDFMVQVSVTFGGNGPSTTVPGQFEVRVDAVADRPEDFNGDIAVTDMQPTSDDPAKPSTSGEATNIDLKLEAQFGDWEDGSERHFFKVDNIPSDWILKADSIPAGWQLVDKDGNPIDYADIERGDKGTYDLYFEVTGNATANQGLVNETLSFDPQDWTSSGTGIIGDNGQEAGRWSDGSLNESGPAKVEISAIARETATDDDDYTNNESIVSKDLVEVSLVEDTPDISYDSTKPLFTDEQPWQQPLDGRWETAWGSFSSDTKAVINAAIADKLADVDVPYNLKVNGSSSSPVLGATSTEISYNLHSDGKADGAAGGSQSGKTDLTIDFDGSDLPTHAKLPTDAGFSPIQWESFTDANGNICFLGYIENGSGKVLALSITLEPGDLSAGEGTASLSVVQYLAFEHDPVQGNNKSNYDIKVVITDDDGDSNSVMVRYVSEDDTPMAYHDEKTFNEKTDTSVSGNVLANDSDKADGWRSEKVYGDDALEPTVEVKFTAEALTPTSTHDQISHTGGYNAATPLAGYSVDGLTANSNGGFTLNVGTEYTLMYGDKAVGTFTINKDGSWNFSKSAADPGVVKDFFVNVKYTAVDADGDKTSAVLEVEVDAAPLMVGISGDRLVFESGAGNEQGYAQYVLQVHDYQGHALDGDSVYEAITVTVKITPTSASFGESDLDMDAIKALYGDQNVKVNADGTIEIKVTIPEGAQDGQFELKLPFADDELGGTGTKSDGPAENYTVDVIGIEGAGDSSIEYLDPATNADHYKEVGVGTEEKTTVLDDGVAVDTDGKPLIDENGDYYYQDNRIDQHWDPAANEGKGGWVDGGGYDHENDAHPLDGPIFGLSSSGQVNEGSSAKFTLTAKDPTSGNGGAYDKYTDALDEPVVIKLQLDYGTTDGSADVNFNGVTLVWIGGGTVPVPGATLTRGANGELTVTLPKDFDMSKLSGWEIRVPTVNDNMEHEGPEGADESFSLAISSAKGNESSYSGKAEDVVIKDPHNNSLTLTGGDTLWEGGTFEYLLTYNTTAALKTTNTDTIKVTITLSGTATFGADYTLADIQAANPKLTITQVGTDANGNPILEITITPDQWSNPNKTGNHTVELNIPTNHDNQIGEVDETIDIAINKVEGGEIGDGKVYDKSTTSTIQDKPYLSLTGKYEDDGEAANDLNKGGTHTGSVQENAGKNIAEYQVNFLHDDGKGKGALNKIEGANENDPNDAADNDVAATAFTFDITLKDGSAKFDSNMQDNWSREDGNTGKDANTGDYGWAVGGKLVTYGELAMTEDFDADGNALSNAAQDALMKAINDQLVLDGFATYNDVTGEYSGIYVTDVSNGGRTLTFHVDEGADLSRPLPIQVGAIDDRLTEGKENYEVILSNIQPDKSGTHHSIENPNKVGTNIDDDAYTSERDGFLVGIKPGEGNESAKIIDLPIVLFERDANGNPTSVDPNNPPSQKITVSMNVGVDEDGNPLDPLNPDSADLNKDYYVNADGTYTVTVPTYYYVDDTNNNLPKDYTGGYWKFMPEADGVPAHWEAVNVGIPLNDDRLTEGDERFTVELTGVTGNESGLLTDKQIADNNLGKVDNDTKLIIKDDSRNKPDGMGEDPRDGTPWKDGPALESFVLNGGRLREPTATDKDGGAGDGENAFTFASYTIAMDAVAAEDIIVTLSLEAIGAENGQDFQLVSDPAAGTGALTAAQLIAYYGGIDKMPDYFTAFRQPGYDPATDTNYYVIIKEGASSAEFDVKILHDHDYAKKDGGLDNGDESLEWKITDMVGSEVQWDDKTPDASAGKHVIEDDMEGPWVTLVSATVQGGVLTGVVGLEPDVELGEGVKVTEVTFIGKDNTEIKVTVTVNEDGSFKVDVPQEMLNQDYYYVGLSGHDKGGETQLDNSVGAPIYNHVGPGVHTPIYVKVTAKDIHEVGPQNPGDEKTVTYELEFKGLNDSFDTSSGLGFTIRTVDNTTEPEDFDTSGVSTGTNVGIFLNEDLLNELRDGGHSDFKVTIEPDAGGMPGKVTITAPDGSTIKELTVEGGVLTDGTNEYGSITGKLPTSYDDKIIEGDETFQPVIVDGDNGAGWVRPAPEKPGPVDIIDNDLPSVTISFGHVDKNGNFTDIGAESVREGNMRHESGDEYVVRVALPEGMQLGEGADPICVKLEITVTDANGDPVLDANGDVTLFTQYVTIYPGQTYADVRVTFPDDFISDDGKTFNVSGTYVNEDRTPADPADYAAPPAAIGGLQDGVVIDDKVNGPQLSLSANKSTVGENGEVAFWVTLDKALEEDATVTMKIDLKTEGGKYVDTADGFVLDDIAYIEINGGTYAIELNVAGDPSQGYSVYEVTFDDEGKETSRTFDNDPPVRLDANGDILVDLEMDNGYSKDGFKVILNNDTVSEKTEDLKVTVEETKGGELQIADGSETVQVTDVKDGPTIGLYQLPESEQGGVEGESINIGISLSGKTDKTVSETEITLKLGEDVVSKVLGDGPITVTDANGNEYTATRDGDKVTFTLPKGAQGPLVVNFPLQDNALEGPNADKFVVSLDSSGVQTGECSIAGELTYGGQFLNETPSSMSFTLSGPGTPTANAECTIDLSGIPGKSAIAGLSYSTDGGKTWQTIPLDKVTDGLSYTFPDKVGSSLSGVIVKVDFDTTGMSPAEIAKLKLEAGVSGTLSGQELSLEVLDDTGDTPDGPQFSIAAGADSGNYTEATGVEFTLEVKEGAVPVGQLEQPVTLTFSLTGPATQTGVTVGGHPATYDTKTGLYTVTLPVGTSVADMVVRVPVVEDAFIGTDASIGIKLEGVSGNESKLTGTAEVTEGNVTEGSSAELYFMQGEASVVEGGGIAFSMGLRNAEGGAAMTSAQAVTVTFSLEGVPGGVIDWPNATNVYAYEWNSVSLCWDVTVMLPAGSSSLDIVFPTIDNYAFDGDRAVTISEVQVNGGAYDNYITDATTGLDYALSDPSNVVLQGNQSFDGSGYDSGLNITGGDDYSAITGTHYADTIHAGDGGSRIEAGAGNDTIYAGKGDDVMDGGLGSDVFAWESADFGGSDTILNFDFNCTWNEDTLQVNAGMDNDKIQINFKDLLGETQSLEDLLQGIAKESGSTFSYKGDKGGFQASFLDGDTLQITLTGNNDDTLQTITVESSNSFYQDMANISAQQAVAILEQILKDC